MRKHWGIGSGCAARLSAPAKYAHRRTELWVVSLYHGLLCLDFVAAKVPDARRGALWSSRGARVYFVRWRDGMRCLYMP